MRFYFFAALLLIIDQVIKNIVHKFMYLGQSIPIIDDLLKLTYVRNTGAAFSLFLGFSFYLSLIGIAAVAAIIYFQWRVPKNNYYLQVALAFVLGGSLGNLFDRIVRSYVIDYINVGFWPVFNFADIAINLGVIMLAIKLFSKEIDYVSDTL